MDIVSSSKDKLSYFRIKELKDVLTKLGIAKQGKKQELLERILALLSDEQGSKSHNWGKKNSVGKEAVAKVIDETYRRMQVPGSADSSTKGHSGSDLNFKKPKEEYDDSKLDVKIRCLCGSSLASESMIKCEDLRCHVWQHISCVIIPEKGPEGAQSYMPSRFFCELCRLSRADPFWVTIAHPLLPVKLTSSGPAADGSNAAQHVERMFQLSRADRDLLQKNENDLQVWCILLNDKVPFRMQWPQFPDLVVNGIPVRTTNRPGSQLLGANGRDDGPVITTCSREGINKISFSRCDARTFCFGLRIARRRTVQQVLSLIPKEEDGEHFEDALARVRRCIGGGTSAENADSDSDLEVVADSVTVNLRCPMSGSRMRTAGRFKPCVHMGCFDLQTFVELNQRSRKWQCPICLKNYTLENVIIDPYFNRITNMLRGCDEDINEVEVKSDGSWRTKSEGESKTLGQWHLADGSLQVFTNNEPKPDSSDIGPEPIKEATGLKLGIRKNPNGLWEVSKPIALSSGNNPGKLFDLKNQNPAPLSASATVSYGDGDDSSVNQEGRRYFDFPGNEQDLDPVNLGIYSPGPAPAEDVIVLSDSEEDNHDMLAGAIDRIPLAETDAGVHDSLVDNAPGSSYLGLFGGGDDYEMSLWPPLPTCSQSGSGFQLFNSEAIAQENNSLNCPQVSGFDSDNAPAPQAEDFHLTPLDTHDPLNQSSMAEVNGSLIDNPLGFVGDDPSLQIFLPVAEPPGTVQPELTHDMDVGTGNPTDDWISLRLGGDNGNHQAEQPSRLHQFDPTENRMDSLANTASLLLSMNDERRKTSNNPRPDAMFSHPQQPRSVRARLYLSIDSD